MCFADEILIRVNTKANQKPLLLLWIIEELRLGNQQEKSQIMQGQKCLNGIDDILGVPIVKKVKYLGYTLTATKS